MLTPTHLGQEKVFSQYEIIKLFLHRQSESCSALNCKIGGKLSNKSLDIQWPGKTLLPGDEIFIPPRTKFLTFSLAQIAKRPGIEGVKVAKVGFNFH